MQFKVRNYSLHCPRNVAFQNLQPGKDGCMGFRHPLLNYAFWGSDVLNIVIRRSFICIILLKWRRLYRFNTIINWPINKQRSYQINQVHIKGQSWREALSQPSTWGTRQDEAAFENRISSSNVLAWRRAWWDLTYLRRRRRAIGKSKTYVKIDRFFRLSCEGQKVKIARAEDEGGQTP